MENIRVGTFFISLKITLKICSFFNDTILLTLFCQFKGWYSRGSLGLQKGVDNHKDRHWKILSQKLVYKGKGGRKLEDEILRVVANARGVIYCPPSVRNPHLIRKNNSRGSDKCVFQKLFIVAYRICLFSRMLTRVLKRFALDVISKTVWFLLDGLEGFQDFLKWLSCQSKNSKTNQLKWSPYPAREKSGFDASDNIVFIVIASRRSSANRP